MPEHNEEIPLQFDRAAILRLVLPGVSERTFARLLSSGKFPAPTMRIGRKLQFWDRDAVLKWKAEREQCTQEHAA